MKPHFLLALLLPLLALADEPAAFRFPEPGKTFVFPRDHGAHPDFKIEWWYITGHLWSRADAARRFGFQATFFRQAGDRPGAPETEAAGNFAPAPVYLAHAALLDERGKRFIFQERLNRSGWDAGASTSTLDVRNGNWSLRLIDLATTKMALLGSIRSEALFRLALTPSRPMVVFGQGGVSRKGADPHAASYYLTFPRLETEGTLHLGGEELAVHGQAWMDHEISSSQLGADQAGWDWVAIQLNDGRSIMAYRMRLNGGRTDPYSTLAWIGREGAPRHFGPDRFQWQPLSTWKSPATGAVYPNEVRLTAPDPDTGRPVALHLIPLIRAQELTGSLGGVAYWEGACRVVDEAGREIGSAFLELTGYAGNLSGVR